MYPIGFFWDDLPLSYISKFGNNTALFEYLGADRPLSYLPHKFLNILLGNRPLNWRLFIVLLIFINSLLIYKILTKVNFNQNFIIFSCFLFILSPWFAEEFISRIYSIHFLTLSIFLISINQLLTFVKKERLINLLSFTILSLISLLFNDYLLGGFLALIFVLFYFREYLSKIKSKKIILSIFVIISLFTLQILLQNLFQNNTVRENYSISFKINQFIANPYSFSKKFIKILMSNLFYSFKIFYYYLSKINLSSNCLLLCLITSTFLSSLVVSVKSKNNSFIINNKTNIVKALIICFILSQLYIAIMGYRFSPVNRFLLPSLLIIVLLFSSVLIFIKNKTLIFLFTFSIFYLTLNYEYVSSEKVNKQHLFNKNLYSQIFWRTNGLSINSNLYDLNSNYPLNDEDYAYSSILNSLANHNNNKLFKLWYTNKDRYDGSAEKSKRTFRNYNLDLEKLKYVIINSENLNLSNCLRFVTYEKLNNLNISMISFGGQLENEINENLLLDSNCFCFYYQKIMYHHQFKNGDDVRKLYNEMLVKNFQADKNQIIDLKDIYEKYN